MGSCRVLGRATAWVRGRRDRRTVLEPNDTPARWVGFLALAHVAWGVAGIALRARGVAVPSAGRLYRCMGSCLGNSMRTCPGRVDTSLGGLLLGSSPGVLDADSAGLLTLHGVSSGLHRRPVASRCQVPGVSTGAWGLAWACQCGPAQVELTHRWAGFCWGPSVGVLDACSADLLTLHGVSSHIRL